MLFVAAVREELGALPGEALGVGVVRAAAAMARLLATQRPAAVVLVGSAGAYAGGPPIGAAIKATAVCLADGGEALGLSYAPLAPGPIAGDPALLARVEALAAVVVTVGAITVDRSMAAALGARGAVEHLEAYGAALACQEAGVPFLAVLGIANEVGPQAHAQWRAHRAEAEAAARRAVGVLAEATAVSHSPYATGPKMRA